MSLQGEVKGQQLVGEIPITAGVSPIVEVTEIEQGHEVSITDIKGKKTFSVLNGKTSYEYAQEGGYEGTEEKFAEKLAKITDNAVYLTSPNGTQFEITVSDKGVLVVTDLTPKQPSRAGTFDADGNLIHTWDELMTLWGGDLSVSCSIANSVMCTVYDSSVLPSKIIIPKDVSVIGGDVLGIYSKNGTIILPDTFTYIFEGTPSFMTPSALSNFTGGKTQSIICVPWSEGELDFAPWGANNSIINYNYTGEE